MIKIGTAGNVCSGCLESLEKIHESGLGGQEIEFVRQVYMDNETAERIGKKASELGLSLSVHASYFINLNSDDKKKVEASKNRIILACERAHYLRARNVVFHPGYYGKTDSKTTFRNILDRINEIHDIIKNWNIVLCPETGGKKSAFGSLNEILELSEAAKCGMCIDFAHLLSRKGKVDYNEITKKLPHNFHAHYSGIEYTEKGEKKHIMIIPDDFRELVKALKKHRKSATIICESPEPYTDALIMKRILDNENNNT